MRVYVEATAGMMRQRGWTANSIVAGDTITVAAGNIVRSGDGSMMGTSITIGSGDVLTMRIRELVDFGVPLERTSSPFAL